MRTARIKVKRFESDLGSLPLFADSNSSKNQIEAATLFRFTDYTASGVAIRKDNGVFRDTDLQEFNPMGYVRVCQSSFNGAASNVATAVRSS
jgi:hypothetical protein